jgi:hypothetical protein
MVIENKRIFIALVVFFILAVGAVAFVFLTKKSDINEGENPLEQTDINDSIPEEIIASESIADGCRLRITTNKKVFFIDSKIDTVNLPEYENCENFLINKVAPSGEFIAFQGQVSGERNSQTSVYVLKDDRIFQLEDNGVSKIFDMMFLPDGRLITLCGIVGAFNNQYLKVYDIAGLFKNYPANMDYKKNNFSNLDKYSKKIILPNIGKDYVGLSRTDNKLIIQGQESIESGIKKEIDKEINLDDLNVF